MESGRKLRKEFMSFIKLISTLSILLAIGSTSFSQTTKQIEKATKVFYKDFDKGIAKLRKYMNKADYPSLAAYEVLVKMEFLDYDQSMAIWEELEFQIEDPDENTNDSTMQALVEEFKALKRQHFINVCRAGTMESYSYTADMYLRIMMVDENPDSTVSDEAMDYFAKGEQKFGAKKYKEAAKMYKNALKEEPTFYKATLYLGDTFWLRQKPDSALAYYERAKEMHPGLLEPRKYIIDALVDQGLFYRAKKECFEALCIYPGFDIKMKMQNILEIENKWMNDRRFTRDFYPNNNSIKNQPGLEGVWNDYREAKYEIKRYCDKDGIIEDNGVTKDKYLEVFSFRQMLDKNVDKELPKYLQFALKMEEEGFLEPYVFISMFHIDIYPQFKHYMSDEKNREKAIDYIEKYLIVKIES